MSHESISYFRVSKDFLKILYLLVWILGMLVFFVIGIKESMHYFWIYWAGSISLLFLSWIEDHEPRRRK
jgi:hypothetical protein